MPEVRVVATLPGSLPMGGVEHDTPIFAFSSTPDSLVFKPTQLPLPTRKDIDLGGLIAFEIDHVLSAAECDAIVQATETFGYRQAAPGISTPPGMRMNKSVHWVTDEKTMGEIFRRIQHLLPPMIDGRALATQLSHRINMYKYDDNDVFNRHIDGDWPGYGLDADRAQMVQWPDCHSALSMLLYLNGSEDGVQGGETRLFRKDGTWVDVTPKKGSALFFRHGFTPNSVVHEGRRVTGPVAKYLARINVLYS
jgi:hypothetical protein